MSVRACVEVDPSEQKDLRVIQGPLFISRTMVNGIRLGLGGTLLSSSVSECSGVEGGGSYVRKGSLWVKVSVGRKGEETTQGL